MPEAQCSAAKCSSIRKVSKPEEKFKWNAFAFSASLSRPLSLSLSRTSWSWKTVPGRAQLLLKTNSNKKPEQMGSLMSRSSSSVELGELVASVCNGKVYVLIKLCCSCSWTDVVNGCGNAQPTLTARIDGE